LAFIAHHVELDHGAADLGIDDGDQRPPDVGLGNHLIGS
jgi:hypothetical protein